MEFNISILIKERTLHWGAFYDGQLMTSLLMATCMNIIQNVIKHAQFAVKINMQQGWQTVKKEKKKAYMVYRRFLSLDHPYRKYKNALNSEKIGCCSRTNKWWRGLWKKIKLSTKYSIWQACSRPWSLIWQGKEKGVQKKKWKGPSENQHQSD